ncbi:DUF5518 domain-containing protein [Natronomonas sp. EA1]|uniref:DUF5518 domain-containing protein n=1 Tax=Natronomonas sp. EA1 TaxID=3421655 RepID=UPI003EBECD96
MSRHPAAYVLVGTLVSAVLFGVPGGPALGGGLASYLDGRTLERGVALGALVGAASAVVVALLYATVVVALIQPGVARPILPTDLTTTFLLLVLGYGLVVGAVGGLVGSHLPARRGV